MPRTTAGGAEAAVRAYGGPMSDFVKNAENAPRGFVAAEAADVEPGSEEGPAEGETTADADAASSDEA